MKIRNIFNAEDFCIFIECYCHNVKHRPILIDRYCDGLTFAELSDKYQYSERSIKKIVYKYDKLILKFNATLERD